MIAIGNIEGLLHDLAPQVLGILVRRHGDFDACEDAVQEALVAAAFQWPADGVPANPTGWLVRVASRRWIEQQRSDSARRRREEAVAGLDEGEADPGPTRDDTLALVFLCCHPSLTPASQVALTLRAVGGLTTAEIARAFLVPEATVAQRISRAKQRIRESGAEFTMPPPAERHDRLGAVLNVLYLIFNEGYAASSGPALQRVELSSEAIRLTRQLRNLLPDDGEVAGLLALMLLTDARRPARVRDDGSLVPLAEQDRMRWDRRAIEEGTALISANAGGDTGRPLPAPGGDCGGPRRGTLDGGHGLAADPRPLRVARQGRARPDGHAQPDRRARDGPRPGSRACRARARRGGSGPCRASPGRCRPRAPARAGRERGRCRRGVPARRTPHPEHPRAALPRGTCPRGDGQVGLIGEDAVEAGRVEHGVLRGCVMDVRGEERRFGPEGPGMDEEPCRVGVRHE